MGNRGHVYRNDGVDIFKDSSKYNSYYVGDIEGGEWLQYTIDVLKKGVYNFTITVAPGLEEGRLSITSNDNLLAKQVIIPANSNMHQWQNIVVKNIQLSPGSNRIWIHAIKGGFNLERIKIAR